MIQKLNVKGTKYQNVLPLQQRLFPFQMVDKFHGFASTPASVWILGTKRAAPTPNKDNATDNLSARYVATLNLIVNGAS